MARSFWSNLGKGATATIALSIVLAPVSKDVEAASMQDAIKKAMLDSGNNKITDQVTTFKDLPSTHWAYESVQWGLSKGLVVGYEDGTYKPKAQILESEFVTVLSRYSTNITVGQKIDGAHWSQHFYDALAPYALPLKGQNNKVAKNTALSRGQIAQIIAAKNGFNLDERQSIYYMYENDISYGVISGKLTFDSYGKDQAVNREQIPAFFQRLHNAGHTTFMGKPSPVQNPQTIGGIANLPKDNTVITDAMFDQLAKDKGITTPTGTLGTMQNPITVSSTSGSGAFYAAVKANPSIKNSIIGKVGGILTPVDMNTTMADPEYDLIIATSLSTPKMTSGFNDKDLFIKIIQDNWVGNIIDQNQFNHFKNGIEKYYGTSGIPGESFIVRSDKSDIIIGLNGTRMSINVYKKGWSAGNSEFEIRQ